MRVPRAYLGCLLYWAAEHTWQVRGGQPGCYYQLDSSAHLG